MIFFLFNSKERIALKNKGLILTGIPVDKAEKLNKKEKNTYYIKRTSLKQAFWLSAILTMLFKYYNQFSSHSTNFRFTRK